MESDTKSSQNAYEMYKLEKENWKKYRIMSKKVDFWPNLHETSGCYENIKNDGHTIDISKYPRRMNEQLMKVSAP